MFKHYVVRRFGKNLAFSIINTISICQLRISWQRSNQRRKFVCEFWSGHFNL